MFGLGITASLNWLFLVHLTLFYGKQWQSFGVWVFWTFSAFQYSISNKYQGHFENENSGTPVVSRTQRTIAEKPLAQDNDAEIDVYKVDRTQQILPSTDELVNQSLLAHESLQPVNNVNHFIISTANTGKNKICAWLNFNCTMRHHYCSEDILRCRVNFYCHGTTNAIHSRTVD